MATTVDLEKLDYDKFQKMFEDERNEISAEVLDHINRLADMHEFINCETYFHSKRQMLIESMHKYIDTLILFQNTLDISKSKVLNEVLTNPKMNFSYKGQEDRNNLINGDVNVATCKKFIDLLNNQIGFISDTKETIEGIIYNMKYRFEVQKYINVC